jgi:hypothetical protein
MFMLSSSVLMKQSRAEISHFVHRCCRNAATGAGLDSVRRVRALGGLKDEAPAAVIAGPKFAGCRARPAGRSRSRLTAPDPDFSVQCVTPSSFLELGHQRSCCEHPHALLNGRPCELIPGISGLP